jgi:hypothetical protein
LYTAVGTYPSANACGGIERAANGRRACKTRARCRVRAVAVLVGTTVGRARA